MALAVPSAVWYFVLAIIWKCLRPQHRDFVRVRVGHIYSYSHEPFLQQRNSMLSAFAFVPTWNQQPTPRTTEDTVSMKPKQENNAKGFATRQKTAFDVLFSLEFPEISLSAVALGSTVCAHTNTFSSGVKTTEDEQQSVPHQKVFRAITVYSFALRYAHFKQITLRTKHNYHWVSTRIRICKYLQT